MDDEKVIDGVFKRLRGRLSPHVAELRYFLDTDSTGDDAIKMWVVMKDTTPESVWSGGRKEFKRIEEAIRSALRKKKIERWPYIYFRSESEQAELDAEDARTRTRTGASSRRPSGTGNLRKLIARFSAWSCMRGMDEDKVIDGVFRRLRGRLSKHVAELRYFLDTDSTGDDAIKMWVGMKDTTPESVWTGRKELKRIEEAIRSALRKKNVERWPYIYFRGESEQAELDAEDARARRRMKR